MTYYMRLNPEPFDKIASGRKTIELCLYDENRKLVKPNDEIIFTHIQDPCRSISVIVDSVITAASFESFFKHMRDHLLTDREGYVSLSQLAAEHEISVSHLQKIFKLVYGVPVYHYIKEYRLEQAAVELVRSAKPVTQIAQAAGYDNASKFSACFKARYGATPSQYRAHAKRASKRSSETKTE